MFRSKRIHNHCSNIRKLSILQTQTVRYTASVHNDETICDVAIIGSGIMGLNTAYQIGRRSPSTKIKVFEQNPGPGYSSSGSSSSICRNMYTFENMIRFAQNGMYHFQNWKDYLQDNNVSGTYTKTGLLLISPMSKDDVNEQYNKYKKLNISTSIIDKNIMKERFPQINNDCGYFDNEGNIDFESKEMDNSTYFFMEEEAGYVEPTQSLIDLQNVIRTNYKNNIKLYYNSTVNKILHSNGKIKGIQIINNQNDNNIIHCKYVINCCGPYYNKIINELGGLDIELTIKPVRMQVVYKDCPNLYTDNNVLSPKPPIPIIMDYLSGVYMRPQIQSKQILIGTCLEQEERDLFDPYDKLPSGADPEVRNKYLNSMFHRLDPIIDKIGTSANVKSLSGLYTVCEDDVHYLIGPTKLDGFIVCNGFSGHGFKCAPAVGSMLAQYLTNIKIDGDTDVDMKFFSPYREPHKMKIKNVMA